MKNIKIGKIYQIYGNDYNLTISPINATNNIDLTLCEQILRKSELNSTKKDKYIKQRRGR